MILESYLYADHINKEDFNWDTWVMGHIGHGSRVRWVTWVMGQSGVTHSLLCAWLVHKLGIK